MEPSKVTSSSSWECPEGCGGSRVVHEIFAKYDYERGIDVLQCPPPPEPRECCGRLPGPETENIRRCSNGGCSAWWCVCGVFTGISAGRVRCGCEYDRGEVPTTRDDAAAVADNDIDA